MQDRRAHWEDVYRTRDDTAVSWHEEEPAVSLSLIDRIGIGPGARIVDVGAGASRLVDRLLARGCRDITLLDISAAALAQVRARLGHATPVQFVAGDVLDWAPSERFDLWHDRAVFRFLVSPQDRARYRAVLERAVAPGGHAVVATFAPDGPERCSGLPVQRHDSASVLRAIGPEFRLVESLRHTHRTPSGAEQRFVVTLARRS